MVDPYRPHGLYILDPMQSAADRTPALAAIRSSSEDARFHARFEVGAVVHRHLREKTVLRLGRWVHKRLSNAIVDEQLGIDFSQARKLARDKLAICGRQHFRTLLSHLRSVQADPHMVDFLASVPKRDILFEIFETLQHWSCNHPMHVYFSPSNILQNAFVSGGLSSFIMVLGQTID